MAIDTDKLQEFLGRFVTDLSATFAAGSVVTGHHLGLHRARRCPDGLRHERPWLCRADVVTRKRAAGWWSGRRSILHGRTAVRSR